MDREFVKELIELLKGSNIRTLKIESGDLRIEIETHEEKQPLRHEGKSYQEEFRHQELLPPSEDISEEERSLHVIKSPLVGTFYRSPSPGAPPFVEVVKPLKILVENGETVEYGQPLFLIDTNV